MEKSDKNIVNLFLEAAVKYADNIAIVEKNKQVSFGDLKSDVEKTAAHFVAKGIKKGDRVLVFVPMSIDLYRNVLALYYIGATAVFLDAWVSMERMEVSARIAKCAAFIGIPKARIYAFFSKELRRIPIKLGLKIKVSPPVKKAKVDVDQMALLTFTTGSTGTPKAANRTHGFLYHQFEALIDELKSTPDEVDMPMLPIVLFINLGIGNTSVIADFKPSKPDKIDVSKIIKQLKINRVERIIASPYIIKRIAEYVIKNDIVLPALKRIFTGGAPVFESEAKIYKNAFKTQEVNVVYGSTEAEPISLITADDLIHKYGDKKGLCVGQPYHNIDIRIVDVEDVEKALGTCEIGEIIVAGDHVLKAYYNNEKAQKETKRLIDGVLWHRTGDSGYLDEDGILFLNGRVQQIIHHKGEYYYPFVIENQLLNIEGVVIGTMLLIDNKLQCLVEISENANFEKIKSEIFNLELGADLVKNIKQIPRDPRHNSKIDYGKLKG